MGVSESILRKKEQMEKVDKDYMKGMTLVIITAWYKRLKLADWDFDHERNLLNYMVIGEEEEHQIFYGNIYKIYYINPKEK